MPSRRQFVGAIGTAMALPGCSAFESATTTEPDQSVSTAISARLVGPETDQELYDGSDIVRVYEVNEETDPVQLPLELSDAAATSVTEQFRSENVSEKPGDFEIQMLDGDEQVHRLGVSSDLAVEVESDEWDGRFVIGLEDRAAADDLRSRLLGSDTATPAQ